MLPLTHEQRVAQIIKERRQALLGFKCQVVAEQAIQIATIVTAMALPFVAPHWFAVGFTAGLGVGVIHAGSKALILKVRGQPLGDNLYETTKHAGATHRLSTSCIALLGFYLLYRARRSWRWTSLSVAIGSLTGDLITWSVIKAAPYIRAVAIVAYIKAKQVQEAVCANRDQWHWYRTSGEEGTPPLVAQPGSWWYLGATQS